ncbi:MAG: hypothetical protein M3O65_03055, partial [Actinomycetota bacterium]|nr:hypothetical protein [Actinomycetota bacterium]
MAEEPGPGPLPGALELLPAGPLTLRLAAPASKSVTNRALVCAALASGTSLDGTDELGYLLSQGGLVA